MHDASAPAGRINIGLLWHSVNSGNLGVGALTLSNLAIARIAAVAAGLTPRFRILGFVDSGLPIYVQGPDIEVVPLSGKAMLPGGLYSKALRGIDCVLDIGGGDSFTDIYGPKRFAYLWLTKAMISARHIPLVLSPQTVGPFSRQPQTMLAARAMKRAQLVVARDPVSFDVARQLAPDQTVLQAVDVAFNLPYERRKRADAKVIEVGLNVSGLLFNRGYSGANEFGMQIDYAAYSRALIAALTARPSVKVSFGSHGYSESLPMDDDRRVAKALAQEFPQVALAPEFSSPSEAKSYISGLDFLVAGRMHACIAAYSSGVPVVPVAYSRKFSGLFEGILGYPHMAPVTGMDTDAAVAFTLDLFDRRAALAKEIEEGMTGVEALLAGYRDALTELFKAIGQARS